MRGRLLLHRAEPGDGPNREQRVEIQRRECAVGDLEQRRQLSLSREFIGGEERSRAIPSQK
jgi:hypothetical protein